MTLRLWTDIFQIFELEQADLFEMGMWFRRLPILYPQGLVSPTVASAQIGLLVSKQYKN